MRRFSGGTSVAKTTRGLSGLGFFFKRREVPRLQRSWQSRTPGVGAVRIGIGRPEEPHGLIGAETVGHVLAYECLRLWSVFLALNLPRIFGHVVQSIVVLRVSPFDPNRFIRLGGT